MNRASFLRSLLLAPFAAKAVLRGAGSSARPPSYLDSKVVSVPYCYYPPLDRLREWRRLDSPYDPEWLDSHSRWPDQAVRSEKWEAELERRGWIKPKPLGLGQPLRGLRENVLVLDEGGFVGSKPRRLQSPNNPAWIWYDYMTKAGYPTPDIQAVRDAAAFLDQPVSPS